MLLKIWLYGYFHRIRSTRKLEAACREHPSLLWLSGLIQPDHNSLWRFWNTNKKALRQVFKQTVQLALKTGAVSLAPQALDGTKIQAACSGPKGWRKEYLEKLLAQWDAATQEIEDKVTQENPPATVCPKPWRNDKPCGRKLKQLWPNWKRTAASTIIRPNRKPTG